MEQSRKTVHFTETRLLIGEEASRNMKNATVQPGRRQGNLDFGREWSAFGSFSQAQGQPMRVALLEDNLGS